MDAKIFQVYNQIFPVILEATKGKILAVALWAVLYLAAHRARYPVRLFLHQVDGSPGERDRRTRSAFLSLIAHKREAAAPAAASRRLQIPILSKKFL